MTSSTDRALSGPGVWWLLLRSIWLLVPLLGAGLLTGPVLLVLGRYARITPFLTTGAVFTAAAAVSYLVNNESAVIMHTVTWILGMVTCLALNPVWLRSRWDARTPSGTAGDRSPAPAAPGNGDKAAAALLADPMVQTGTFLAGAPAAVPDDAGPEPRRGGPRGKDTGFGRRVEY